MIFCFALSHGVTLVEMIANNCSGVLDNRDVFTENSTNKNFDPFFSPLLLCRVLKTFDPSERVWYSLQALSYKLAISKAFQPTDLKLKKLGKQSEKLQNWEMSRKERFQAKVKITNIITYYIKFRVYIFQHILQRFFLTIKHKALLQIQDIENNLQKE